MKPCGFWLHISWCDALCQEEIKQLEEFTRAEQGLLSQEKS